MNDFFPPEFQLSQELYLPLLSFFFLQFFQKKHQKGDMDQERKTVAVERYFCSQAFHSLLPFLVGRRIRWSGIEMDG